jgi:Sec-independent protein secretion pathway component TatC
VTLKYWQATIARAKMSAFQTLQAVGDIAMNHPIRRAAYFVLALLAALATPSTDPWSLLGLWLGLCLLFEGGFFVFRRFGHSSQMRSRKTIVARSGLTTKT